MGFGKRGRGWFTAIEASAMQVAEPYCKTDNLGRVIIPFPFPLVALYLLSCNPQNLISCKGRRFFLPFNVLIS